MDPVRVLVDNKERGLVAGECGVVRKVTPEPHIQSYSYQVEIALGSEKKTIRCYTTELGDPLKTKDSRTKPSPGERTF